MFVYQNKKNQVCITFKDNKPVEIPEYELEIKDDNLIVNGETFAQANNDSDTEVFKPIEEEIVEDTAVELGSFTGIEIVGGDGEVVDPSEPAEPVKPVAVLKTNATLKVAPNVTLEIVPNTLDLAGHTLVIEGGQDSKVANFEVKDDSEGKIVLKNITVLGGDQ